MKKIAFFTVCILLLAGMCIELCACNDTPEQVVVTPEADYVTITYVVSPELYTFEAPAPQTMQVGTVLTLPLPEGAVPADRHNDLCWFDDATFAVPHDNTQPITADTTVYLYEVGKTYRISYEGLEGFTVTGNYVYSYQYDADGALGAALPQASRTGYYTGLYCIELEGHYQRVPTAAGRDLTFTAPKAIPYTIHYDLGLDEADMATATNPNPTIYDKPDEVLVLQPAVCEGKTFDRWVLMVWTTPRTFEVDGETIELKASGTTVTRLSYEMITWGDQNFTLEARWQ